MVSSRSGHIEMLLDFQTFFLTPEPPRLMIEQNRRRTLVTGRGSGVVTPDFDLIEPGEADVFTFDISHELAPDETVSSSAWECALAGALDGATADGSPANRISGLSNVTSRTYPSGKVRTFTNQMVSGMLAGNYYYLRATLTIAPAGRTIQRYSRVLCQGETFTP